jgi:hypothetical protein
MPLCKIRTSKLTYQEIYRINGRFGFLIVALLKLLRCDFPTSGRYLLPCFWSDMQVADDTLSNEARRCLAAVHSSVPPSEGSWESHFFQRPHKALMIADSGGAIFFAPGSPFHLMHVYVKTANGSVATCTYVGSFRQNGHTVSTTNNGRGFESVPGSECHVMNGSPEALVRQHRVTISKMSDLATFQTFQEFIRACDQREKLQSDWDLARGAYAPA